jgi:hypothetical protein
VTQTWNPWSALEERRHLLFGLLKLPRELGGAVYFPIDDCAVIFIDPREPAVRRRCLLAHELVHDERDGGCDPEFMPVQWKAVVHREEGWVNDIVADRLVPPDELARFCQRVAAMEMGVTARDVAVEFDVTDDVAERALARLARAS